MKHPNSGISPEWPTREAVIRRLERTTPWPLTAARSYNDRSDAENTINAPPSTAYGGVGTRLLGKAEAQALKDEPWTHHANEALGYIFLATKLEFFWHSQFRIIFPEHPRPLRRMNWELIVKSMALAFIIGRETEAKYQGCLAQAVLNRTYQLQESYEFHHRRVHAFMLRLFADWRSIRQHDWPKFAFSEPIYESILKEWKNPETNYLGKLLFEACDRHTQQSKMDTEREFYDCSTFPRIPLEILLVFRLRELIGLNNPVIDHPLMDTPFRELPDAQSPYVPDDLAQGTMTRLRVDWPDFDRVVSIEALQSS